MTDETRRSHPLSREKVKAAWGSNPAVVIFALAGSTMEKECAHKQVTGKEKMVRWREIP
jgi:hypothetical protein